MKRTEIVETQEDKIRHNGQENFDSVPLGGTAMAALVDPSMSHVEERPTKMHPTQSNRRGIVAAATVR